MPDSISANILITGKETFLPAERLNRIDGLSVFTATCRETTLSALNEYDFALVFLLPDSFPGEEFETAERIRQEARLKPTPVIFYLTEGVTEETIKKIYDSGVSDVLTHDMNESAFFAKVSFYADLFRERVYLEENSTGQLQTSREKYKSIFNTSRDGIVFMSLEGQIENANQSYCDMLGYEIQDLIFTDSAQHTPEKWLPLDDEILRTQVITKGYSDEYKKEYIHKENGVFPVRVRTCLVRDKSGNPLRLLSIVRDITERSQLEMRLRQSHKMESVGAIAGGIAHDFNNILGAIIGYAQLAKFNIPEDNPASDDIENIIMASGRAKDLVTHILGFSRATEQVRQPVQLRLLVNEVLKLIRASFPSTIEIRKNLASNGTIIMADPTEMHQVVMNLCTNAFHAMKSGFGIMEISLTPVTISAHPTSFNKLKPGPYVQLSVTDNGSGIDPEIIEKIFDPYFTTKEKGSGTGLGLSVVQEIVRGNGGDIAVTSDIDNGTTVSIFFPQLEISTGIAEKAMTPLVPGTEKILFVDDEPSLVYVEKIMLQKLGYHVISSDNALDAYETFCLQPDFFDIVITDMTMPGMTGTDLAEKIHSLKPEMPIILCSGYDAKQTAKTVVGKGISRILPKPVEIHELSNAIRELMKK